MSILPYSTMNLKLPKMYKVKQYFDSTHIPDIHKAIDEQLEQHEIKSLVKPNQKIAIAVGSRGIYQIDKIVRIIGDRLKQLGADPFIVPAMGSHGGAAAEGQRKVLKSYGIDEKNMGMPILSSMDVEIIGKTPKGVPVYFDKNALNADLIIPVARIKPHTNFKGPIESGICKMLAIGLGKHEGCSRYHQEGFEQFPELIPEVAKVIIENAPIGFGIGIVENAYEKTFHISAVNAKDILTKEPELLFMAQQQMAKIMISDIDVLIIEKIGKEISGAGMDPNIIGRDQYGKLKGYDGPNIKRIIVKDLTEQTNGNASGIGIADFITRKCFNKIDFESTYTNCIAGASPEGAFIPIIMESEELAIRAALQCCNQIDFNHPKIVRISDTLHLEEIEVSECLLPDLKINSHVEILS